MKAKELMIGDWTKFRESKYPYKRGDIYKIDNYNSLSLAHRLCGVPLTEEILKANGIDIFDNCDLSLPLYTMGIKVVERGVYIKMQFKFVHELQHAFRLCGLDELADNFKV